MKPLRVLLISHTYFPSAYRGKLRHLAARGDIELHLAAIPRRKTGAGWLCYEHSAADTYPQYFLPSVFQSHNVLRLFAPLSLIRLLQQVRPHIVHIEVEPHALALTQIILLRPVSRYRVLFFTWENIYRSPRFPLGWIEQFNLRRADAALAGNTQAAQVLKHKGFCGTIQVVPQVGVEPAHCEQAVPAPEWAALRQQGSVVGFVGRLVFEKGVADLLEAFARLPESLNAQLLLIGAGALREELAARAEQLGIAPRVHCVGNVPFRDVPGYLKCMDVMVLPSRTTPKWKEQFGHVLVEAMACGVPVVGSDSGAIPEIIGDAGLIFPEGDIAELCARLSQVLEDSALRRELIERGIRRATEHYSDAVVAAQTYQAYRGLCPEAD